MLESVNNVFSTFLSSRIGVLTKIFDKIRASIINMVGGKSTEHSVKCEFAKT